MKILFERKIQLTPGIMQSRTYRSHATGPRSPGAHTQAINKYLAIGAGKLDKEYAVSGFTADCYPLLPALGVAWEEFRASHYSDSELLWQPGELCRDEIYGSPDGLWIAPVRSEDWAIWECKLTTGRLKPLQDCWLYTRQGMAYCAMHDMRLRRVLYDVCSIYRPYQPEGMQTLVEFSESECEIWFKNMRAVKDKVTAE